MTQATTPAAAPMWRRLRDTYNHLYDRGYPDSGSCYDLADLLLKTVQIDGPVLDVGCGHCPFLKMLETDGISRGALFGLDISDVVLRKHRPRFNLIQGTADRLPFAANGFDVVYSADMLEHLDERTATRAIEEMVRVSNRHVAVGVNCRPAETRDEHGAQVHLTVRPPAWWEGLLVEHGEIIAARTPDPIHGFYVLKVAHHAA